MTNVLTLETNKYAIKLENFEGPLDLLCTLVEKNKMSIYDIDGPDFQYVEYDRDEDYLVFYSRNKKKYFRYKFDFL